MFSSPEQNGCDGYEYTFVRVGNSDEPEYIVGQVKNKYFNIVVAVFAPFFFLVRLTEPLEYGVGTFF